MVTLPATMATTLATTVAVTLAVTLATTLAVTLANMRTALEALGGEQAGWAEPERRHGPHLPRLQLGARHG